MTEMITDPKKLALPLSVRLVVGYFLITGLVSLAWPFLGIGADPPGFAAKSFSYRLGAHFAQALMALTYIAAGIAIVTRRPWAVWVSFIALAITFLSSANGFAWGAATQLGQTSPSSTVRVISYSLIAGWHLFLAFLLYRGRAKIRPVVLGVPA